MEESRGSGDPSNSSGRFQVRTLGRHSDTFSAPILSVEVFLYTPLAIFAPFWGSNSLMGTTSPSLGTSLPFYPASSFYLLVQKGNYGQGGELEAEFE